MSIRPYNVLVIALALCMQALLGSASAAGGNDRITEQNILSTEKALRILRILRGRCYLFIY